MAPAVMCNAAVTVGRQEHHLVFPGISAEWPAVAENHGVRAGAPVLEINLCTVLGGDYVGAVHGFVVMRRGSGGALQGGRPAPALARMAALPTSRLRRDGLALVWSLDMDGTG